MTKTFRRTLRSLAEIAQRVREIAALLEMQSERRRDIGRSLSVPFPQPLADTAMDLNAPAGRQPLVKDVLIQNMVKGV